MKTINITLNLFKYEELSEESRQKAFDNQKQYLWENPQTYETENDKGELIEKYDNMDEWTQKEIIEYVEEIININEYLFFEDGEQAPITRYVGKHNRAGEIDLRLFGKTYKINRLFGKTYKIN